MLGSHFDLAKEIAVIASRREREGEAPASKAAADDRPVMFGSAAELDRMLDQVAGFRTSLRMAPSFRA